MRVAVLVIGLCLGLLLLLTTCVGAMASNAATDSAGQNMVMIDALLWMVGSGFALGRPRVSVWCFGLAACLSTALGLALATERLGLIWVLPSLVLAALAYLGERELKAKRAESA